MGTRRSLRDALRDAAYAFAFAAAFPRLAHRLRWPTRLGPRGLALYIAFNTATLTAVRIWVLPALRHAIADREATTAALRDELGREPTEEEVNERYMRRFSR